MRASRFTVATPVPDTGETFLFNSLTDAQILVSADVVDLIARVDRGEDVGADEASRRAVDQLAELGFLVESREAEAQALERYFRELKEDGSHFRVTLLTTLQCNFACDYCVQGDHDDHHSAAARMSLDTATRVAAWIESRLDVVAPERFTLTFFGGEPLLNLPVVYALADRLSAACRDRGVGFSITIITNGLLLTEAVVDRLLPLGLSGVKITLDGDQATHDRLRPLRGGQGTFERILANLRAVAPKVRVSIGGNFDVSTAESYPALLDFLRRQPFADRIAKVAFKPIIRGPNTGKSVSASAASSAGRRVIPLAAVSATNAPLGGTCMTVAGHGGATSSPCDSCGAVDERMSWLRAQTKAHGFETVDGFHMGPCELYRRHAATVGPDGAIYPCPGFSGEHQLRIGHVDPVLDGRHAATRARFETHEPWRACGDCALVPVCGGGCSVASHHEQADLSLPNCHRPAMLAALDDLAAASARVPA